MSEHENWMIYEKIFNKRVCSRGLLTKTRFVSGGDMIETLSSLTYPTVTIILMIIALNRLEMSVCNRTIWRGKYLLQVPNWDQITKIFDYTKGIILIQILRSSILEFLSRGLHDTIGDTYLSAE